MTYQTQISFDTRGRGTTDITADIERLVDAAGVLFGTCHVFLQHTSASLLITENADPTVRRDL
ncbi:MAG: YjbQ family protein, partial [bacterium]|nr:YjbQ family protein [bacterium]